MLDFWPIYKRECKHYFQTPSTYVVFGLVFLICGYFFANTMSLFVEASRQAGTPNMMGQMGQMPDVTNEVIRNMFGVMIFLMMFALPLLAMHLLAEEKSRGTFEVLATCPVGDWSIIMGKYLALLTVGLAVVILSGIYPAATAWAGRANHSYPEMPVVASCWLGLFIVFATYAAFGVMASAFTENQMTAAIVALAGLIGWNILGFAASDNSTWWQKVILELTISQHTNNFLEGVLMLKDFAFFILAAFVCLFVASKTLDARRWRI